MSDNISQAAYDINETTMLTGPKDKNIKILPLTIKK